MFHTCSLTFLNLNFICFKTGSQQSANFYWGRSIILPITTVMLAVCRCNSSHNMHHVITRCSAPPHGHQAQGGKCNFHHKLLEFETICVLWFDNAVEIGVDVTGLGYIFNQENIKNMTCSSQHIENIPTAREPERITHEQRLINHLAI